MQGTDIPIKDPELLAHELDQQLVLVQPILGKVKVINQVGTFVWTQIDGHSSVDAIVSAVINSFAVDPQVAQQDVLAFLSDLLKKGLISLQD